VLGRLFTAGNTFVLLIHIRAVILKRGHILTGW
jgi:hypothetical protein